MSVLGLAEMPACVNVLEKGYNVRSNSSPAQCDFVFSCDLHITDGELSCSYSQSD